MPAGAWRVRGPALFLLWTALGTGCGYSMGYRAPPGVSTVAVPMFDNASFPLRREVEFEVTSALRKEIQSRTPLVLTDDRNADMVIYGKISDFRERVAAEGNRDEKIESNVVIEVALVIEDYRNGRQWRERVKVQEPLSTELGETLDEARRRAVGNLAEKIVEVIESWGDEKG